ncbi:hypothetical protein BaRGS_00018351, partial [Batillaria attramentaria]
SVTCSGGSSRGSDFSKHVQSPYSELVVFNNKFRSNTKSSNPDTHLSRRHKVPGGNGSLTQPANMIERVISGLYHQTPDRL